MIAKWDRSGSLSIIAIPFILYATENKNKLSKLSCIPPFAATSRKGLVTNIRLSLVLTTTNNIMNSIDCSTVLTSRAVIGCHSTLQVHATVLLIL